MARRLAIAVGVIMWAWGAAIYVTTGRVSLPILIAGIIAFALSLVPKSSKPSSGSSAA